MTGQPVADLKPPTPAPPVVLSVHGREIHTALVWASKKARNDA